uniref:Uncharacterized protein n=1 Tax=Cacopsylla melanoneura TaxID=428564 RepID=A0A8D8W6R0_9HEMI
MFGLDLLSFDLERLFCFEIWIVCPFKYDSTGQTRVSQVGHVSFATLQPTFCYRHNMFIFVHFIIHISFKAVKNLDCLIMEYNTLERISFASFQKMFPVVIF